MSRCASVMPRSRAAAVYSTRAPAKTQMRTREMLTLCGANHSFSGSKQRWPPGIARQSGEIDRRFRRHLVRVQRALPPADVMPRAELEADLAVDHERLE